MGKRDYLPIIAILAMWLMTAAGGSSTLSLDSTQLTILCFIITAPLLLAIILSFRAVHKKNKTQKE